MCIVMNKFVFRGLDMLDADYFCRCLQTVITNFKSYTSFHVFLQNTVYSIYITLFGELNNYCL